MFFVCGTYRAAKTFIPVKMQKWLSHAHDIFCYAISICSNNFQKWTRNIFFLEYTQQGTLPPAVMSVRNQRPKYALSCFLSVASKAGVSNLFGQRATCNLRMIARATGVVTAKKLLNL